MSDIVMSFGVEFAAILGGLAGAVVAYYLRQGIQRIHKSYDIEDKQELAHTVVKFIEQTYTDFKGSEKYKMARQRLIELATESGLELTETQVETFIEEAVRNFKDEYGEGWAKEFKNQKSEKETPIGFNKEE